MCVYLFDCFCWLGGGGGACGVGTWKQRWNAKWNSNEIQMQACVWISLIYFRNYFLTNLFQESL